MSGASRCANAELGISVVLAICFFGPSFSLRLRYRFCHSCSLYFSRVPSIGIERDLLDARDLVIFFSVTSKEVHLDVRAGGVFACAPLKTWSDRKPAVRRRM